MVACRFPDVSRAVLEGFDQSRHEVPLQGYVCLCPAHAPDQHSATTQQHLRSSTQTPACAVGCTDRHQQPICRRRQQMYMTCDC